MKKILLIALSGFIWLASSAQKSGNVKGIVFLGTGDTYVNYAATKKTLAKHAPHFSVVQYDGAFHELHNETPQVSEDVIRKILDFL